MSFIVIVVALLLDQVLRLIEHLRLHRWYEAPLASWAGSVKGASATVQLLAALALSFAIAFVVGAIGWGFASASAVLGFIYAVLVLVLCLGPRNLNIEISAYLKARAAGDAEGARQSAALLLEGEPPQDAQECGQALAEAAFVRAGDWLFSVLFWFALLGPLGAALFRCADVIAVRAARDCPGSAYAHAAKRLKLVMAWVPMHLLAFTYAIAGSFDEAMGDIRRSWRDTGMHFLERGAAVVLCAGRIAIRGIAGDEKDEVELLHAAVDLIWRSVVIWLAVIGVITLLGWLF
ncbi:MAG: regulatory signaling modulator protein AmpE [Gammaproteobacteria bacterium]